MKTLKILCLLISGACFSQARYSETKISQNLQPDCSISSTTITTKVFAKEDGSQTWVKVYESEVAVEKTKYAKTTKNEEYHKAELAGEAILHPKTEGAVVSQDSPTPPGQER